MAGDAKQQYPLEKLRALVRSVPDFPKPGILFRDITPLLANAQTLAAATAHMAELAPAEYDSIAGVEARGFLLGAALAASLGKAFVPLRRPGKLPAATHSASYSLEYGTGTLEVHSDALDGAGKRVWVVDDLLATGGTLEAACKLIRAIDGQIAGITVLIELDGLDGWKELSAHPHNALLRMSA